MRRMIIVALLCALSYAQTEFDDYDFMGIGYCADSDGNRLDVHYQYDSPIMNPSECALICDEQSLCRGFGLDVFKESACEIWVANGEGPIEGIENEFGFWGGYSGSEIHSGDGTKDYQCYRKNSPTMDPSSSPSTNPTGSPSFAPTTAPTNEPTMMPTMAPSASPSMEPTNSPSMSPSSNPSMSPSSNPSFAPTTAPTMEPTMMPTMAPSASPSMEPTNSPMSPSSNPSMSPSSNPSFAPTTAPTKEPTMNPTMPTAEPSTNPTVEPTEACVESVVQSCSGCKCSGWYDSETGVSAEYCASLAKERGFALYAYQIQSRKCEVSREGEDAESNCADNPTSKGTDKWGVYRINMCPEDLVTTMEPTPEETEAPLECGDCIYSEVAEKFFKKCDGQGNADYTVLFYETSELCSSSSGGVAVSPSSTAEDTSCEEYEVVQQCSGCECSGPVDVSRGVSLETCAATADGMGLSYFSYLPSGNRCEIPNMGEDEVERCVNQPNAKRDQDWGIYAIQPCPAENQGVCGACSYSDIVGKHYCRSEVEGDLSYAITFYGTMDLCNGVEVEEEPWY